MNPKQIKILAVILIFLAAGVLLKTLQKPKGLVSEDYSALNFAFDPVKVEKISVKRGGKEILSAVQQNKTWFLPGLWNAPASDTKIDKFLEMIRRAKGELRTDDAALLDDFGMGDQAALSITLTDAAEKPLLDLRVGTRQAGAGSVFVRRANSNAVFFTNMNLAGAFESYTDLAKDPIKLEVWADLEPLKLAATAVTAVEVRRFESGKPRVTVALKRGTDEKKEWVFAANGGQLQIDPQKTNDFMNTLLSLRAQGIVAPLGSYGLDLPVLEIKIESAKGEPAVMTIGAENTDKNARYFRVNKDTSVYTMAKFLFDGLNVSPEVLAAAQTPPSQPAGNKAK